MRERRLPEALGEYASSHAARFHMPGHKGRGMGAFFNANLAGWDITELSFSDNLYNPTGALLMAQRQMAKCYRAQSTFFLVNGSTAGLHAMLLSLPPGANLLVGRDCHRAVLTGAALAGHRARFVTPAYSEAHGLWGCVDAGAIDAALTQSPADAVVVTSPNYYGLCADIKAIASVAGKQGALLLVDAAHGAHFPFSSHLPDDPGGYADAWVVSAHKTMNALGQAALLHTGAGIPARAMRRALSIVQTSSPSYLLMASLDWARYTATLGECWDYCVRAAMKLRRDIARILGLAVLPNALCGRAGVADMDMTRLVIDVVGRGITGYAAQAYLEEENVFIEMSDAKRIVLILTPADDPRWYEQLLRALERLPYGVDPPPIAPMPPIIEPQAPVMPLYAAMRASAEECAPEEAAGRIAADCAGIYPPGIPLWAPGERITEEAVQYLLRQSMLGATLFGVRNGRVGVVRQ
ncbi:MAG: aminotransferase class V-fold PLP-dependent enzyme [Clostridiales bacterium]|jgi:arginine/lysine/ornithine decarboxylase|nr:aminotransferase class V-fold PLP-dependent enzyme [Clostridiales bacterium]